MEIEYLRCVWAVFQYKNFSEAAYQLSQSQSSVSKNVAKIENELNIQLFERSGKKVHPTPVGESVMQSIETILREEENIKHCAQLALMNTGQKITIGSTIGSTVGGLRVVRMIAAFAKEYPHIEVEIIENTTYAQISALLAHRVDITTAIQTYVSNTPCGKYNLVNDNRFICEPYYRDRYFLVVNKCHPLSQKTEVDLHDLVEETFVTVDRTYDAYHEMLSAAFRLHSLPEPKIAIKASSIQTVADLVESNAGITILPSQVASNRETLALIPLRQPLMRETMIVALRHNRLPKHIGFFLRYAKQYYASVT